MPRRALDRDTAAVGLHDGPGYGQAQAAAAAAAIGLLAPVEALEDVLDLIGGDARPLIAHLHDGLPAGDACPDADGPARWRELDGVADDVVEGLFEARRVVVHDDVLRIIDQVDVFSGSRRAAGLDGATDGLGQVAALMCDRREPGIE